ncbi:killer cell lectin-like receptor subfamily F member 1 isoform X2 [Eublepharis macularius]|uniref:Killer cell lectin-like receptor subfamily F member 1 isoform X2 n=1 Tax=Eublepharis macularius TaxID=481883 RepID=A0AA97L4Z0_EUBMA|nr:killer cell lectin-like receptor subfamily F member 1 isoform X2 [Eublepharis macularius]
MTVLQRDKEEATRQLVEATSCQRIGCCPNGWTLFRWKCLWVSNEWKAWEDSKRDCERQSSQLLILKPWDAGTLGDAAGITSLLQSNEFWIGLKGTYNWFWYWVDGSLYAGKETRETSTPCQVWRTHRLPWSPNSPPSNSYP